MACYNPETEEFQSVCRVMSGFSDAFYIEVNGFHDSYVDISLCIWACYQGMVDLNRIVIRRLSIFNIKGKYLLILNKS